MSPAPPAAASSVLSGASRYGALQRAFNDKFREWCWQRNAGTFYQIWNPPGVVFSLLKKDYWEHGRNTPKFSEWGFSAPSPALHLVLGALGGRWAVGQARRKPQEQWVVVDSNDHNIFQAYFKAMVTFGLEAEEPDLQFPNLRLLFTNERHGPRFFDGGTLHNIYVHLPRPARETRPEREPLVTPTFLSDACRALAVQGEMHLVTDNEDLMSQACAVLTSSRLFAPCVAFPFHEEGLPETYPARTLLEREAAFEASQAKNAAAKTSTTTASPLGGKLYYSRWEKKPEQLPNFRFRRH